MRRDAKTESSVFSVKNKQGSDERKCRKRMESKFTKNRIDFEHWMAQIIKGDSCIGGVDGNPVEPCGAATDDTPPEG